MTKVNGKDVVLLAGGSVPALADSISSILDIPLGSRMIGRHNDGEVKIAIGQDVPLRGKKVFIIQSTPPPGENWFELWFLADAARRAGASDVIWVAPYIGYGRQDRKIKGHDPISAAVVLEQTITAGVKQIISVDLHSGQLQGFIPNPFGNLWGRKLILKRILAYLGITTEDPKNLSELAFIAPDAGSYGVAMYYAQKFGSILIGALKNRPKPGVSEIVLVGGEKAEGRTCILLDDAADTLGTLKGVSERLHKKGAKRILAGATHPLLTGNAIPDLEASPIEKLFVSDSIPLKGVSEKIEVVSVAEELAKAITLVMTNGIVSELPSQFD